MRETIAAPGSDLYYSWLFLEPAKKAALIHLYTWCDTLSNMITLKEDDIFNVKCAWWQQEMARMLAQQATHPDTIALQHTIISYKIPETLWYDYLEGIKLSRQLNHCCTAEDFTAYSYRGHGLKQILAAYVYGFRDPSVLQYARAIGEALAIMDEIIWLGRNLKQDRVFLPLTTIASWHEVPATELHDLLHHEAHKAKVSYQTALALLPQSEYRSQHPSRIAAQLKYQQLMLSKKDFSVLLHGYSELTPLRKYLTARSLYRSNRTQ